MSAATRNWKHDQQAAVFSAVSTFDTAVDVTPAELSIELFYPADEATARMFTGPGSTRSTLN